MLAPDNTWEVLGSSVVISSSLAAEEQQPPKVKCDTELHFVLHAEA